MNEYSLMFQYDPDDKIYVGSVLEIPWCMAHGDTQEEALKELKSSLALWLKCAEEDGLEIPKPMHYAVSI